MRKKIYKKMLILSGSVLGGFAAGGALILYLAWCFKIPAAIAAAAEVIWLVICYLIAVKTSGKMTKKIVQPIQKIDLKHPEKGCVYEEMQPILLRMGRQKKMRQKNEKLRQEFSSNVSHELKTPLTSISGYAELLMNGMVPPEDVPSFSAKIYNEAGHMIRLIDDIIKLSKLDERPTEIEKEPVDLYEMATDAANRLEMLAKKNRVTMHVEGAHTEIQAIPQMTEELIYNLCENAIKYNKTGGSVTVTVGQENDKGKIIVKDTGIGIPEKYQDRVFERFFRVDKSHSRQIGGTGLGLAIVKHIVEYHGGDIRLESRQGQGTTFTVVM